MLKDIKALLEDIQLREKLRTAKTLDDAMKLLATAGAEKRVNLRTEDLSRVLSYTGLALLHELSEAELLGIAGGAIINAETDEESCPLLP
jgi:hypothetical protein